MNASRKARIGAAAAMLAACAVWTCAPAVAQNKPFAGVELRVGTYGGPWTEEQKRLATAKMEALGAKLTFVSGSPQINFAKLVAARGGPPPMDTIEVSDGTVKDIRDAGFLQPINPALIPNAKFIGREMVTSDLVRIWTTQESMCYNEQKFKELGIPPLKTYADLANPKLAGHVDLPDIVSGGGMAAIAGFSHANGGDLANIKPGLDAIVKIGALKYWKTGTEVLNQFKSGDVYAAALYSGWCVRGVRAGMPLQTAHPVINANTTGVIKVGWIGVLKGIDKKTAEAAHAYINLFLDTEFQREFALTQGVVPENLEAMKDLAKDPVLNRMLVLDPAKIARMLNPDYSKVNLSDWHDQWARTVAK